MAENDARPSEALQEVPLSKAAKRPRDEDLTEVVGELVLPMAVTPADLAAFEDSCAWCFQTHRVEIVQLFLSRDRKRAMIVFRAPDAESVRLACRRAKLPVQHIWACDDRVAALPRRRTAAPMSRPLTPTPLPQGERGDGE